MDDWPLKHLVRYDEEGWGPMRDAELRILKGIEGKAGVRGKKSDGTYIGADFIKMEPGTRFPMHTHEGDHQLFFMHGTGYVEIDDKIIFVGLGDLIHIPGKYPHAVGVPHRCEKPLVFLAVGHPHHPIGSHHRMVVVDETVSDE